MRCGATLDANPHCGDEDRGRLEYIEGDLDFARDCLSDCAFELSRGDFRRAKEALGAAHRSHDAALEQLPAFPTQSWQSVPNRARLLAEACATQQVKIKKGFWR